MSAIVTTQRMSLEPSSFGEMMTFAQTLAKSSMVPKDYQGRPENIIVAVAWGREIGLGPLQAMQNVSVINGRPSIWGDAALALVRGSGICDYVRETVDGDGDNMVATCRAKRKDDAEDVCRTFSVSDAKKAGLWGKAGPWQQYSKRMLQLRARGFALRDAFPDVLRGVITAEEAADTPVDAFRTATLQSIPVPAAPAITHEAPAQDAPRVKQTATEWLDELEAEFVAAPDADAVDAIVTRDRVQRALDYLKNGALTRLNAIIKAALDRTAARDDDDQGDDGWPGPVVTREAVA